MLLQEKTKQIGTIAKESGVPIKTIRYYEEIGLLKAAGRTEGGFRLFDSDVLDRLNFIKRAQSLGLSLLEIKDFLGIHDRGELPCDRIEAKLQSKVTAIDKQIQELMLFKQELQVLLSKWQAVQPQHESTICPIIQR
jgi:MerR family transcriptional regulator, copper efflux regulator